MNSLTIENAYNFPNPILNARLEDDQQKAYVVYTVFLSYFWMAIAL